MFTANVTPYNSISSSCNCTISSIKMQHCLSCIEMHVTYQLHFRIVQYIRFRLSSSEYILRGNSLRKWINKNTYVHPLAVSALKALFYFRIYHVFYKFIPIFCYQCFSPIFSFYAFPPTYPHSLEPFLPLFLPACPPYPHGCRYLGPLAPFMRVLRLPNSVLTLRFLWALCLPTVETSASARDQVNLTTALLYTLYL